MSAAGHTISSGPTSTAEAGAIPESKRTVHVSNLSASTSEDSLKDFLSFCGVIDSLELDSSSQSAKVVFKNDSAAATAAMLNGTTLDSSVIKVNAPAGAESDAPVAPDAPATPTAATGATSKPSTGAATAPATSSSSTATAKDDDAHSVLSQEEKPRSAIASELLAHGYKLSDDVLKRALAIDQQHGISSRFKAYLESIDKSLGEQLHKRSTAASEAKGPVPKVNAAVTGEKEAGAATSEKAEAGATSTTTTTTTAPTLSQQVQQTVEGVLARPEVQSTWSKFSAYWTKAANHPTIHQAYTKASRSVQDIHEEAKRLAAAKQDKAAADQPTFT